MTYLTTRQVADAVSLSTRQVEKWPAKATPNRFRRTKRQGRFWWRADALIEWLTERGYTERAASLEAWCVANAGAEVPRQKPARRKTARKATVPTGGMDIFATRDVIAGMLVDTIDAYRGATSLEIASSGKAVRDTADILRKIELDCIEIDLKLKRLMPVNLVEQIVGRILSEARTNLQTLRYSMVEDLAAMSDTAAIGAYLEDRFTAALRCLEATYLTAQVAEYMPETAE